jgi:hypothetical protein
MMERLATMESSIQNSIKASVQPIMQPFIAYNVEEEADE